MGFQVYRTREVETDEINFELLNMPPHHPARDMWDTFYTTTPGVILRTHTSPGQIHVMRERCPEPIRVILPGMCYRYEQITARSEIQFHQVEGLAIGRHITMADLKGTIDGVRPRAVRPEASARASARATSRSPSRRSRWTSSASSATAGAARCASRPAGSRSSAAGMVHPVVLQNGGYDPREFTGFAFGMGPQRITMLKHAIDDIRYFWANDLRFLEQF